VRVRPVSLAAPHRARTVLGVLVLLAGVSLAGCGTGTLERARTAAAPVPARWSAFVHVRRPLDVIGPRADGSLVLAAAGRLWVLSRTGGVKPFPGAYKSPGGEEPYIAIAPALPGGRSCFRAGTVYALRLAAPRGVSAISPTGQLRRFARITAPGLIDGIAFDQTGRFGYRLLVTVNAGPRTTLDAIGCHGAVSAITHDAPRVEGGITVAPRTFGRFAGDLIAPDETGGRIFALGPQGQALLVASSGLPHGNDVGVESETFIPDRRNFEVLVADRLTPGNRHPGDDVVLRIGSAALLAAGARGSDLLVSTEGGAQTDAISCGPTNCRVLHVADGPAIAHVEGHIAVR